MNKEEIVDAFNKAWEKIFQKEAPKLELNLPEIEEINLLGKLKTKEEINIAYKQLERIQKSEENYCNLYKEVADYTNKMNIPRGVYEGKSAGYILISEYEKLKEENEKLRFPMKDTKYAILTEEEYRHYQELLKRRQNEY